MLETDKQQFSVEPFLNLNGELITWNDVKIDHSLAENYIPIPSVRWISNYFTMDVTAFAGGEPGGSVLYSEYLVTNTGKENLKGNFYLALRPFR